MSENGDFMKNLFFDNGSTEEALWQLISILIRKSYNEKIFFKPNSFVNNLCINKQIALEVALSMYKNYLFDFINAYDVYDFENERCQEWYKNYLESIDSLNIKDENSLIKSIFYAKVLLEKAGLPLYEGAIDIEDYIEIDSILWHNSESSDCGE